MKKILLMLLIYSIILPLNVLGKGDGENVTTKNLTRIEAMSKHDKLTVIYICGGVILVGSFMVLVPIIKIDIIKTNKLKYIFFLYIVIPKSPLSVVYYILRE